MYVCMYVCMLCMYVCMHAMYVCMDVLLELILCVYKPILVLPLWWYEFEQYNTWEMQWIDHFGCAHTRGCVAWGREWGSDKVRCTQLVVCNHKWATRLHKTWCLESACGIARAKNSLPSDVLETNRVEVSNATTFIDKVNAPTGCVCQLGVLLPHKVNVQFGCICYSHSVGYVQLGCPK